AIFDPSFDRGSAAHAQVVRQQLAATGIDATVLPWTFDDYDHPAQGAAKLARADIFAWSSDPAIVDPVAYLRSLPYLSHADAAALDRLATVRSPARETAATALATRL